MDSSDININNEDLCQNDLQDSLDSDGDGGNDINNTQTRTHNNQPVCRWSWKVSTKSCEVEGEKVRLNLRVRFAIDIKILYHTPLKKYIYRWCRRGECELGCGWWWKGWLEWYIEQQGSDVCNRHGCCVGSWGLSDKMKSGGHHALWGLWSVATKLPHVKMRRMSPHLLVMPPCGDIPCLD